MSEATDLAARAGDRDPRVGLRAVAALRMLLEQLEAVQVRSARNQGVVVAGDRHGTRSQQAGRAQEVREALMFERFTKDAQAVVQGAVEHARRGAGADRRRRAPAARPAGPWEAAAPPSTVGARGRRTQGRGTAGPGGGAAPGRADAGGDRCPRRSGDRRLRDRRPGGGGPWRRRDVRRTDGQALVVRAAPQLQQGCQGGAGAGSAGRRRPARPEVSGTSTSCSPLTVRRGVPAEVLADHGVTHESLTRCWAAAPGEACA